MFNQIFCIKYILVAYTAKKCFAKLILILNNMIYIKFNNIINIIIFVKICINIINLTVFINKEITKFICNLIIISLIKHQNLFEIWL